MTFLPGSLCLIILVLATTGYSTRPVTLNVRIASEASGAWSSAKLSGQTDAGSKPVACQAAMEHARFGCVYKASDGKMSLREDGTSSGCIARGVFVDSVHSPSNFGKLKVSTSNEYSDSEQMYAAGYVEGWLTAERIYDNQHNMYMYFTQVMNASIEEPLDWVFEQRAWAAQQVASQPGSQFWRLVGLLEQQFMGLVDGYQARAKAETGPHGLQRVGMLSLQDLVFVNYNGDLYDLIDYYDAGYGAKSKGAAFRAAAADAQSRQRNSQDKQETAGGSGGSKGDLSIEQEIAELFERDAAAKAAKEEQELAYKQQQQQQQQEEEEEKGSASQPSWQQRTGVNVLQTPRGGRRLERSRSANGRAASKGLSSEQLHTRALVDPDILRPDQVEQRIALAGKCSALVKVTGDLSDLLLGHSTWDTFTAMMRIYKHFELGLREEGIAANRYSFSSYPGELFSDDDFYLLSSGLVLLETTNHIYRPSVYKVLSHESVMSWQRVRIANWLAHTGGEWLKWFSQLNSGTYNNQYMVVDLKAFKPKEEMLPGLLWVIEQLPGKITAADMTEDLERGYWPSYNVAYFPDMYEAAGYPDMIARLEAQGEAKHSFAIHWLKYQVAARATIFRRDQGRLHNLQGIKDMMRYNDYTRDPAATGIPTGAICGRGDQHPTAPEARGCYDSKVTSYRMALALEAEVIGGPTTSHGIPPFTWDDPRWAHLSHRGMPAVFNFTWERMRPGDLPLSREGCAAAQAHQ